MEKTRFDAQTKRMALHISCLHWAACLFIFVLLIAMAKQRSGTGVWGEAAFCFYLAAGFYLYRVVLKPVIQWHPMYQALLGDLSVKLRFFFLWPIAYLSLLMRLGISKLF